MQKMPRGLLLFALAFVLLGVPLAHAADTPAPVTLPGDTGAGSGAKFSIGRPTDYATTVLAFSADGKTVAATTNRGYTGGMDAPVHLWDVATGKHLRTLKYHTVGVMAVAFSPDGATIATSGIDNFLRLWDGKTGKDITKEALPLSGHGYALTFSADGKRLLVGSTRLEMYDVETQKPLKAKGGFFAETERNQFFHTATWSPKGKYVAAACDGENAGVRIWEADTGNLVRALPTQYTANRTRFAFSADDKLLLVSTWPKGLFTVFDVDSGKELKVVDPPKGEVSPEYVQFAREMGRVAWVVQNQQYQQGGRTIVVADATGQELKRFEVLSGVGSHILSPDGARLAVGGQNGSLRVYAAETGKVESVMLGGWGAVYQTAYADAGKLLRVVHTDGLVHDFDADTGKPMREAKLDLKTATFLVALSADGAFLASATEGGEAVIWDLNAAKELSKPKGKLLFAHRERVFGFGPGGLRGPVPPQPAPPPPPPLGGPGGVRPPPPPLEHDGPPQFAGTFSTDGKIFAAVSGDGKSATVWETATGAEKHAVKVPSGSGSLAFSTDGTHLFVGQTRPGGGEAVNPPDPDGEKVPAVPALVRLYELKTGKETQNWKATPAAKKDNGRYAYSSVVSLHPLPDNVTLLVVEQQSYNLWPPPPIPAGARMPMNHFTSVRLIDLTGKANDTVLQADRTAGGFSIAPDGKRIAFVSSVAPKQPGPPLLVVRVIDVATKVVTEAELTGVRYSGPQPSIAFRPDGKEFVIGTGDGSLHIWEVAKLKATKPDGQ